MPEEDAELLRRLCQGCEPERSFELIRQRYEGLLRCKVRHCCLGRDDSFYDDVMQNVWVKIWTKACQYDPSRNGPVVPWLLQVACNTARDGCKKKNLATIPPDHPDSTMATEDAKMDQVNALGECIKQCLESGTASQKRAVLIFTIIKSGLINAAELVNISQLQGISGIITQIKQLTGADVTEVWPTDQSKTSSTDLYKWTHNGKKLLAECVQRKLQ